MIDSEDGKNIDIFCLFGLAVMFNMDINIFIPVVFSIMYFIGSISKDIG